MSKILETQLPLAYGDTTSVDVFNRLVRILEINLGSVDPDNTLQLSTTERDKLNFNIGTLIFNTTTEVLQVYNGHEFLDLGTPANPQGYQAKALVGNVSIKTNGDITINLGSSLEGWGIEKYYT
tara:strand:+ start:3261 stop:3632 length:372 start_codon:yes stop_codon:yes gene_type:complete